VTRSMTQRPGTPGPPELTTGNRLPAVPEAVSASAASPPVALYIHVPFCVSICPYCDFVVYAGHAARGPAARVDAFVAALHSELDLRADAQDARFGPLGEFGRGRRPLGSVYLGGGTPSLLPARDIAALLDHVERRFGIAPGAEVTLEANPGPDEIGDLAGFRATGVTRLSLGAQSLHDDELRFLGRRHRAADVTAAVGDARQAGFTNVSLDLLYDVPGQTLHTWQSTLQAAVDLDADHVSTYALTLDDPDAEGLTGPTGDHLPLRRGARAWRARARAGQDEDRAAEMDATADAILTAAGLPRYEIANHARSGEESRHNLVYWQRRAYEALGPGAHAFDGDRERRWNAARLDAYLAALVPPERATPNLPPGGVERITPATARSESVILALRLREGVAADVAGDPAFAPALIWALESGLADRSAGRVRLTQRGRMLSNEVFARLLPADEPRDANQATHEVAAA
jgi:oxygen-independent coproporphyrinogen-3 oxidase